MYNSFQSNQKKSSTAVMKWQWQMPGVELGGRNTVREAMSEVHVIRMNK